MRVEWIAARRVECRGAVEVGVVYINIHVEVAVVGNA